MEKINLMKRKYLPKDYHCKRKNYFFGSKFLGEVRKVSGEYYSNRERNKYYSPLERKNKHHAKTPWPIAAFAVQEFSKKGDWVFDPFMGAGTSAVEAVRQSRKAFGIEIVQNYKEMILDSIKRNNTAKMQTKIVIADALKTERFVKKQRIRFNLIIVNPPYSGNKRQIDKGKGGLDYDKSVKNNLGHLSEGKEYYQAMKSIFYQSIKFLKKGGYFVIGTRDTMKNKKPFLNHVNLGNLILIHPKMSYHGLVVLKHYPPTLHLCTYKQFYGIDPVYYQSILIFKKEIR